MEAKKIRNGIYLVIDPSMSSSLLFNRLERVLKLPISVVQIWDHWNECVDKDTTINRILDMCIKYDIPVLMNNDWTLLKRYPFDGVHFDELPENFDEIKQELKKTSNTKEAYLYGMTCGNDMDIIDWATKNGMDYISFCSMFPSATSTSCELVSLDSVRRARSKSELPIFLAGGIRPDNMGNFKELDYQGIALISGIMGADKPEEAVSEYLKQLKQN